MNLIPSHPNKIDSHPKIDSHQIDSSEQLNSSETLLKLKSEIGSGTTQHGKQRNLRGNSIIFTSDDIDDDESIDIIDLTMPKSVPFKELPICPEFQGIRCSIYLLFSDPTSSILSLIISIFITLLIIASCVTFILESMPEFKFPKVGDKEDDTLQIFVTFELVAIVIFTIEYCLRLFTAHSVEYEILGYNSERFINKQPCCKQEIIHKTWLFFRQAFNIIDLLAILPFYVSIISNQNQDIAKFSFIRILRLARVFRVFKLGKYTEGAVLYSQVFKKSAEALYLLLLFSLITSVVMGSFIYFFEKGEWKENGCLDHETQVTYSCFVRDTILGKKTEESPFYSIPQSIWWVFTTITTVGYGDIYPTSFMGKCVAIITMHVGILGLALPISIIGTNFREIFDLRQQKRYDQKMKSQLANVQSIALFDEMKDTLNNIVTQVNSLQLSMKNYEQIVKDHQLQTSTLSNHPLIKDQTTQIQNTMTKFIDKLRLSKSKKSHKSQSPQQKISVTDEFKSEQSDNTGIAESMQKIVKSDFTYNCKDDV